MPEDNSDGPPSVGNSSYFDPSEDYDSFEERLARNRRVDLENSLRLRTSLVALTGLITLFSLAILFASNSNYADYFGVQYIVGRKTASLLFFGALLSLFASVLYYFVINYLQLGLFFISGRRLKERFAAATLPSATTVGGNDLLTAASPGTVQLTSGGLDRQAIITKERLSQEIRELGRRGNLNLFLGIFTTIIGVSVLGYVVFFESEFNNNNPLRFSSHFIMRISIAIFIEIFAYFFLKLYKNGIDDIKYYQNEITNIEMKYAALLSARDLSSAPLLKIAVESLAKTERNFVLKKNETTLGLERERMDKNEVLDLVKHLASRTRFRS